MIIDCISDLHGHYPKMEGGDLLIVAGDLTASDATEEYERFFTWLSMQEHYKKRILISGNHDNGMTETPPKKIESGIHSYIECCEYLCDSGTEFEGLKIWGSPWTLWFEGINPKCAAFTGSEADLAKKFALIPTDTDILITHSPPYGIRDEIESQTHCTSYHFGSKSLQMELFTRLKPQLLVCGHIHEGYGEELPGGVVERCVNASHMDENYIPVNPPIRVVL